MYAFCAICSGVVPRFLYPDYQERPLKMLDWSSGMIFPFSVRLLLLKLGLIVVVSVAHGDKYLSGDTDTLNAE